MVERMVAVGSVGPTSARLWARVPRPMRLQLTLYGPDGHTVHEVAPKFDPAADGTCAFDVPGDLAAAAPLAPMTRYRFDVHELGESRAGALVGRGSFRTAPASAAQAPSRWSFAFLSCHQPFGDDGAPTPLALAMLQAAAAGVEEHDAELVLFVGDQIYADRPSATSLFASRPGETPILDASAEDIRRRYQAQYRRFWELPAWQRLHASASTLCVPDDHEVVDNWGSRSELEDVRWRTLATSALQAAYDYQGSRAGGPSCRRPKQVAGLPPLFQQTVEWGNAAFFVLDIRSRRWSSDKDERQPGQIVEPAQLAALEAFLSEHRDRDVLFIIVPVPPVHVPDWVTRVAEAVTSEGRETDDRWSASQFVRERDRLLELLRAHRRAFSTQRLVVLSGDIHAGWGIALDEPDDEETRPPRPPVLQLVSSAITNGESTFTGRVSELFLRTTGVLGPKIGGFRVRKLEGEKAASSNPFGGLNIGLVEVARGADGGATVRFRLLSHAGDEPKGRPVVVFDSGPL